MLLINKLLENLRRNYKLFIGIIIGGVIFGGLGVYAAIVIAATNVGYSDNNDLGADNVQTAIDKLNTKATTKITEAEAKCPSGNICTATWAKLGDYVKMTPTSTSYTVTTVMTGYTSNQTINPSELNLWRVININSDGTLDLVSEYASSVGIYFKGKVGYQNYITTLNQIASQYTNSKYTVASRYIGYNGQVGTLTDSSTLSSTTVPWTSTTSSSTSLSNEAKGAGDMGYEKDYDLIKNVLGTTKVYKVGTTTASWYWLASRKYNYVSSTAWYFNSRLVDSLGELGSSSLCGYNNNGVFNTTSDSSVIRPIITIKSGLSPTGAGTSTSPYVLG